MYPNQTNMKKALFVTILSLCAVLSFSQNTRTVKGKVIDQTTGEPLIGADLQHLSTNLGGSTNEKGEFNIILPDTIPYLIVSFLGYNPQQMFIICDDCEHVVALEGTTLVTSNVVITSIPVGHPTASPTDFNELILNIANTANETNILPLFNSIAGVYVHSGALNTNRMTVRGIGARSPFSTRNIKMYYNDIPITSGDGESLMEDLDVSSFDKIELIKGSSGTTMGAPLGGGIVLNNYEWFDKTTMTSSLTLGSYGLWRNANKFQFRTPKAAIQIFSNSTQSDGYRENNEYDRKSFGINGRFKASKKHHLNWIGHYVQLTGQIPSSVDSATFADSPEKAAANWQATEGYENYDRGIFGLNHILHIDNSETVGEELSISSSVFYNFRNNYEVRPFNILQENVDNYGLRSVMNVHNVNSYTLGWKFLAGFELLNETYGWQTFENLNDGTQGDLLADNLENRNYFNGFLELDLTFVEEFKFNIGLNVNATGYHLEDRFTTDTIDQSGSRNYDEIYSPKLGFTYLFKRFYLINMELYANISHGFSMPSVEETLLPDGLINENLKPEKGWNLEVGTKGDIFDGRIKYDFSAFRMWVTNLIVAERIDADSYVGINAGKTQHDGLEMTLAYEHRFLNSILNIKSSYSLNNYIFSEFINDGEDYSGNALTGVPSSTFSGNVYWQGGQKYPFFASLQYQFVNEMPIFDDNSLFTESYQLVNTKVGYQYKLNKITLDLFLGVNNIFNEKYASMIAVNAQTFGNRPPRLYYAGLPRNVYAGVRMALAL